MSPEQRRELYLASLCGGAHLDNDKEWIRLFRKMEHAGYFTSEPSRFPNMTLFTITEKGRAAASPVGVMRRDRQDR